MNTINEIKIEALHAELEKEMQSIEKYQGEIENLVKKIVRYEVGKKQRDAELAEMSNKLETLKNSIPDFNKETYEKYIQYYDTENKYESLLKYYSEFDQKLEQLQEEISSKEGYIKYTEQRIQNIQDELKNLKSDT